MEESIRSFLKGYGNHMRELRLACELKQKQVAKKVGCSQAIISHIECGLLLPDTELEQRLLNVYKGVR